MTSSSEEAKVFQKELSCSLCLDFLTKPVSIECGHSFCQGCFLKIWQGPSTPFSCPECRHVSQMKDFEVNVPLGKLAVIVKKRSRSDFQDPEEQDECEVHQKVQKLFCEDDQSPVCVSCSLSQEHEAHRLSVIDEAADNFREKLQATVTAMWSKTEDIIRQKGKENVKVTFLENEIEIKRKQTRSEFKKIIQFLNEEKDAYLSRLEAERTTNLEDFKLRINGLYKQNQEVRKRITDLEELFKKSDLDLLENRKIVLNRNESVLQKKTDSFIPSIPVFHIPGLMAQILNFKVDITMDCNTAHPGLIISKDLKSMRYGGVQEEPLSESERLLDMAQVLGTQSFISGRYYWEVEVPDNTTWYVGICKISEPQIFFVLCTVQKNNLYHLFAMARKNIDSPVHRQFRQVSEPNFKVGVFLDCDLREISFYHVKGRYLLYTFSTTSFSEALVPFFALSKNELRNDGSIRICS